MVVLNGFLEDQGVNLSNIYTHVIRMVGEGNKVSAVTQGSTRNTKVPLDLMHTALDENKESIEKEPALARRFLPIKVPEPSVGETILTLMDLKENYEIHYKLRYERYALVAAAELSDQYVSDRFLPEKVIGLIDEAGARVSTRHAELLEIVRELRHIIKSKNEADRSLDSTAAVVLIESLAGPIPVMLTRIAISDMLFLPFIYLLNFKKKIKWLAICFVS